MPPKKERSNPAITAHYFSFIALKPIVRGKDKELFGGIISEHGRLIRICFERSFLATKQKIQEFIEAGNFTDVTHLDPSSPEDLKKIWEITSLADEGTNDFLIFLKGGLIDPKRKLIEKKPTEYRRSGTSALD